MNYLMSIQILPTHPQSRDGYKYISEAIENGEVVQIDKIYEKYCNIE